MPIVFPLTERLPTFRARTRPETAPDYPGREAVYSSGGVTVGKPRAVHLTVREYDALPDDGQRYEILDGRLDMTPAPSEQHQDVAGNLFLLLKLWVRARSLGRVIIAPFDVVLAFDGVVQPDLLYISKERASILNGKRAVGAPELVVEIFHHAGALKDTEVKRQLYARHGVNEYWQVDLDRKSIRVFELTETGYEEHCKAIEGETASSKVLPGFLAPWSEVFRQD